MDYPPPPPLHCGPQAGTGVRLLLFFFPFSVPRVHPPHANDDGTFDTSILPARHTPHHSTPLSSLTRPLSLLPLSPSPTHALSPSDMKCACATDLSRPQPPPPPSCAWGAGRHLLPPLPHFLTFVCASLALSFSTFSFLPSPPPSARLPFQEATCANPLSTASLLPFSFPRLSSSFALALCCCVRVFLCALFIFETLNALTRLRICFVPRHVAVALCSRERLSGCSVGSASSSFLFSSCLTLAVSCVISLPHRLSPSLFFLVCALLFRAFPFFLRAQRT